MKIYNIKSNDKIPFPYWSPPLHVQLLGVNSAAVTQPQEAAAVMEDGIRIDDADAVIVGLAVSWEHRDAYYIAFTDTAATGFAVISSEFSDIKDVAPAVLQNADIVLKHYY